MKRISYILIACSLLGNTACRKYVEIPAEQTKELRFTTDYQNLLYNANIMDKGYYYPLLAADDIGSESTTYQNNLNIYVANAYIWAEKIVPFDTEDGDWSALYTQIYYCNQVINNIMGSEGGTDAQKQTALAYAQVHRAFCYYTLVNEYGKQYNATTAGSDAGVPLVLTLDIHADLTRASVQAVYNQIIADLHAALPYLPALPDVISNPSKAAAYAIFSRVYLNTRNFTEAERFADSTLKLQNTVLDLNNYISAPTTLPLKLKDPETIFYKSTNSTPISVPLSNSLLAQLDTLDLRYQVYTLPGTSILPAYFTTRGWYKYKYNSGIVSIGPSVPEMMLIKAECEARANNASAAISIVNTLRKKRYKPADYTDLQATTSADALNAVVKQRAAEFMGTGARWFDQRRLNQDGFTTTVTRNFKGTTYTLEPGSNRYVLPIGEKYILLNPEIIQNPR